VNVFFAIAAVIGAIIFVHSQKREGERPKLDVPGTLLISGGLFALVLGFSNAETDGWGAFDTWGLLVASGILLVAFVLWQMRAAHPILPLKVVLDRNRGASFLSILIAGSGTFALFLFLTYYLQSSLGYTPIQTGLAFLPMIGMLILTAQFATNFFNPRFGPKVLVPIGMLLAATGLVILTGLNIHSSYADILLPLMFMGAGMGSIMPPSIQTATLGVDKHFAGVASALVSTSQQVGGSIGTSLLNTLAASAATAFIAANLPPTPSVIAEAAVHSYSTVYWVAAGIFAGGAILAALLFRRRPRTVAAASTASEAEITAPAAA
jgi:Major Facilitator Superfamily